jgi:hypothetical protein
MLFLRLQAYCMQLKDDWWCYFGKDLGTGGHGLKELSLISQRMSENPEKNHVKPQYISHYY